jgi:dolichyl-phosphate-mannose-protein mannosyltransferase
MSSGFRQTLGHGMRTPMVVLRVGVLIHAAIDVVFDSEITIRHLKTQGGYLHSHAHNYPGGSGSMYCPRFFIITH